MAGILDTHGADIMTDQRSNDAYAIQHMLDYLASKLRGVYFLVREAEISVPVDERPADNYPCTSIRAKYHVGDQVSIMLESPRTDSLTGDVTYHPIDKDPRLNSYILMILPLLVFAVVQEQDRLRNNSVVAKIIDVSQFIF